MPDLCERAFRIGRTVGGQKEGRTVLAECILDVGDVGTFEAACTAVGHVRCQVGANAVAARLAGRTLHPTVATAAPKSTSQSRAIGIDTTGPQDPVGCLRYMNEHEEQGCTDKPGSVCAT